MASRKAKSQDKDRRDPYNHALETGRTGPQKPGEFGLKLSVKEFFTSFLILLALMIFTGILTRVLPSGQFDRAPGPNGEVVVPGTYRVIEKPSFPVWRWFTAPVEVLGSPDGVQAIVIIIFIMIVGGAFAILEKAGVLEESINSIAKRFSGRKYVLLAIITLFFMSIGSLLGIFEEVIPLVPLAIALSYSLGWDTYVGLGMSILATNLGFSAAIANPFTIGVAQKLAGLPLFSGAGFRFLIFACVFALFYAWLFWFAKQTEKRKAKEGLDARRDSVAGGDLAGIGDFAGLSNSESRGKDLKPARGVIVFGISLVVLLAAILTISLTRVLSDYSMPIIAVLFLIAGFASGIAAGLGFGKSVKAFLKGAQNILPGVILILMAMAIKYIITKGGIMDTILYAASNVIGEGKTNAFFTAGLIYVFTLLMDFFVSSASAKAFLLMPILVPIADMTGLTRQIAVQAYAFGDGFSNMIFPTSAVLLIALGLAGISWTDWFKKTWKLTLMVFVVTLALLMVGIVVGYA
ncbi:MAG TPA: hypothetical protein PLT87_01625 [Spirochaetales bacterium]|nr:hypothetical protein [Spirochaetales bacterium]